MVDKEEEQLVVVSEVREGTDLADPSSLFKDMKNRISEENGIAPSVIVIVKAKTIPKTTSGKISRSAVKQQYLQNELSILASIHSKPEEVDDEELRSLVCVRLWFVGMKPMEIEASSAHPSNLSPISEEANPEPEMMDLNLPSILNALPTVGHFPLVDV